MQDFLFVSFFLGHGAGDRARRLLAECELLDVVLSSRARSGFLQLVRAREAGYEDSVHCP